MSGYIGTQPVPQATQTRDSFTATSGQTSFATGGYTPNFLDVYLNGVKLASADYTATNGSDVVLASGAATGDILEVVAFTTFNSASSSIDDNGNATAITIDSNENVMLNTTSTSLQLSSSDEGFTYANNFTTVSRDGGTTAYFNRLSSDGDVVAFRKNGSTVGTIGTTDSDLSIFSTTASHNGLRFHSTGLFPTDNTGANIDNDCNIGHSSFRFKDAYLSGGVYLGGTGSANKLDDFETGTFTPFMRINNGVEGITYNGREGSYTKIGNLVTVMVYMALSSKGTNVGNVTIDGLPFTVGNQLGAQTSYNGTCLPAYFTSMATNISTLYGWVATGTTEMYLRHTDGSGNSSVQNTGNGNLNNNSDFRFFITYMAA